MGNGETTESFNTHLPSSLYGKVMFYKVFLNHLMNLEGQVLPHCINGQPMFMTTVCTHTCRTSILFFCPLGGRGWASLRGAPTTLGSKNQRKIRETGSSKHPFLRLLDQTSNCSAVGASPRPALPWPPGGFS